MNAKIKMRQYVIFVNRENLTLQILSVLQKSWKDRETLQVTVKILKIGTPEIFTIIVLQLEQLDFTVRYCVQKMQTE